MMGRTSWRSCDLLGYFIVCPENKMLFCWLQLAGRHHSQTQKLQRDQQMALGSEEEVEPDCNFLFPRLGQTQVNTFGRDVTAVHCKARGQGQQLGKPKLREQQFRAAAAVQSEQSSPISPL